MCLFPKPQEDIVWEGQNQGCKEGKQDRFQNVHQRLFLTSSKLMASVAKEVLKYWQYNLVPFRVLFLFFGLVIFLVRAEDRLQWINKLLRSQKKRWQTEASMWGLDGRSRRSYLFVFFQMQEMRVHLYAGKKLATKRTRLMIQGPDWINWSSGIPEKMRRKRIRRRNSKENSKPPTSGAARDILVQKKKKSGKDRWESTAQGYVVKAELD